MWVVLQERYMLHFTLEHSIPTPTYLALFMKAL